MKLSNLFLRLLVAAIAIPLLIILFNHGGWPYLAFVLLVTALAVGEFLALAKTRLFIWQKALLVLLSLLPALDYFLWGGRFFYELLIALFAVLALPHVFTKKIEDLSRSLGLGLFATLYPAMGLASLVLLREGNVVPSDSAGDWVIFLFATVWIVDTAAYFLGMAFGKAKLSPVVSPHKTIVGFLCGFAGAPVSVIALKLTFLPQAGFLQLLWPALLIALFGQLADLVESLFKREAGVKDSSNLIPGHGGALDRFDSILLAGPVLYLYLRYLG